MIKLLQRSAAIALLSLAIADRPALAVCGDGIIDPGESCDDGNTLDGDCCSATCQWEPAGNPCDRGADFCTTDQCDGAGICAFVANVSCADDGNACNGSEACDPATGACVSGPALVCDDGNPCNGVETCDPTLGCQSGAPPPVVCGDGIMCGAEQCDDGNSVNGDGCEGDCTLPSCGNGILDAGEECDDGNVNSCDGCSALCRTEPQGLSWCLAGGPEGGPVYSLAMDPRDPRTLYAGTNGGVFKSSDGAATWVFQDSLPKGQRIQALAVNPADSTVVLAGFTDVYQLVFDPSNAAIVYRASGEGVSKSVDGGASWYLSSSGIPDGFFTGSNPCTLAIDPISPNRVFFASALVYRSTDGGDTWSLSFPAGGGLGIDHLAIDPQDPSVIYGGGDTGIYRTVDGGGFWTRIGLETFYVSGIVLDTAAHGVLYAATPAGIFKSLDGGSTWLGANKGLLGATVKRLVIDPGTAGRVYAATDTAGVWLGDNGGSAWSPRSTGLPTMLALTANNAVTDLAIDPQNPSTLYAAVFAQGLYRTQDAGQTWELLDTGLPVRCCGGLLLALAVVPRDPTTLYAAVSYGIYKSLDGAGRWSKILDTYSLTNKIVVDSVDPVTVYVTDVVQSPNGATGGIHKTTDGGASWVTYQIPGGYGVNDIILDPSDTQKLYAGTIGVLKSLDGGATWIDNGWRFGTGWVAALAVDPSNPSVLYAAVPGSPSDPLYPWVGLYVSSDYGDSWEMLPADGLTNRRINALAIEGQPLMARLFKGLTAGAPTNTGRFLWAGTGSASGLGGVFRKDITPSVCGNGLVEGGEQCDDGNTVSGDCCSATCQAENLGSITCGVGACARTVQRCANGVPQTCTPGTPVPESCNGIDDDCNDQIDEGLGSTTCGVGACARTVQNCVNGVPQTCVPGSPGIEGSFGSPSCSNGIDDDCDGATDGNDTGCQFLCGNGFVDPGEQCDDGNTVSGDCCSATCQVEDLGSITCGVGACMRTVPHCVNGTPRTCTPGLPGTEGPAGSPSCTNGIDDDCDGATDASDTGCQAFCGNGIVDAGEQCDDGNQNSGDGCSANCTVEPGWSCTGQPSVCTGCRATPVANCRTAEKSILLIKDKVLAGNDTLSWKWTKGAQTSPAEFGNPTSTADYALCIYAGAASALVGQSVIPASATKWNTISTKGYKYNDPAAAAGGIDKIVLKGSTQNKSKVQVNGKGAGLPDLSLPVTAPLIVQLMNGDNGVCWGSSYDTAQLRKNDTGQLKSKTP